MTTTTLDGEALGQSPRQEARNCVPIAQSHAQTTLFTERALRAALGGVGERKFRELRAAGVVPDPLLLGARCPRWTIDDFHEILRRLPRRKRQAEPQTLAEGRRARIAALKAGA